MVSASDFKIRGLIIMSKSNVKIMFDLSNSDFKTWNYFIYRCLALGATYGASTYCTDCYYKPGSCGSVHQGTPIPAPPPLIPGKVFYKRVLTTVLQVRCRKGFRVLLLLLFFLFQLKNKFPIQRKRLTIYGFLSLNIFWKQSMVFCYQNCSNLLWEKICNFFEITRTIFFKQWQVRTILDNRMVSQV